MKIARVESFFFNPGCAKNLLFVRIETESGIYGWGEGYVTAGKEKVVAAYVDAIAPHLIGREIWNIRQLAQTLLDDFSIRRTSVDFLCALSAVEIASWDIVGKRAGLPVHKLLGGAVREKIRVYANGWWFGASSIDDTANRAAAVVAQGYDALKWDPIPGPWRNYVDPKDLDHAVENVRAVREAVGPNVELLIDGHRRLSPNNAIRLIERLREFGIAWYEEPCPPENLDLTAEVRRTTNVPIVSGEALYTKEQYLPLFEKRAADIINPDISAVGGILAMLDIAALAQPHSIAVSPHNFNSPIVGLAATVHLSALVTNFTIAELFVNLVEPTRELALQGLTIADGYVDIPDTPGLGVDLDVEVLRRHPYQPLSGKGLRDHRDEFPRRGPPSTFKIAATA
ncbi:mandelate racemase (plasmid) [Azospirillum sp. TSH58]|uniref:mandelate racemase/muconate lactonizing enzyme family protein n=1 Tax=Azospirillum sp. TSH58 TaxID=664962 RepID=UPI000D5FFFA2|nr:mandelate racemase/muconate lactonizing enzyme family protein [Azospirillum sp. TSH58]AWJ87891.1 mandelate racemase [Azospirillum sp. TSH58]PWC71863.1 mandelate racemase [Azospirillum sp. TSH58]